MNLHLSVSVRIGCIDFTVMRDGTGGLQLLVGGTGSSAEYAVQTGVQDALEVSEALERLACHARLLSQEGEVEKV